LYHRGIVSNGYHRLAMADPDSRSLFDRAFSPIV
jgi:hypothetical protein